MSYRSVIFDLDGTLVDTGEGIINSVRYAEAHLGLVPVDDEKARGFIGPPPFEAYQKYHHLDEERALQAVKLHREFAQRQGIFQSRAYSGILPLLHGLKRKGKKLGVATLKKEELAITVLRHVELDVFDAVAGVRDEQADTKAKLILAALEQLGISRDRAVFVGDSGYDAVAAEEIGMDFIGVIYGYGFTSAKALDQYSHVGIAEHVDMLMQLLQL